MQEFQDIPISRITFDNSHPELTSSDNVHSPDKNKVKTESRIIQITNDGTVKSLGGQFLVNVKENKSAFENSNSLLNYPRADILSKASQNVAGLFRLFVKNGEYVYARPNDIVMLESCDHMVKVYLAPDDKIKKTIRYNTLKDFLLQLPKEQFVRIGRFCAVNIQRLSGGNCNEQTFEFDFRVSIKLKHAIPQAAFNSIGK